MNCTLIGELTYLSPLFSWGKLYYSTDFFLLASLVVQQLPTYHSILLWEWNPKKRLAVIFFFFNPHGNRFDFPSVYSNFLLLIKRIIKICKSINMLQLKAFIYDFSSEPLKKQGVIYSLEHFRLRDRKHFL